MAAPGTCIVSDQLGGGLSTYYGTSQAAPFVAAAVGLYQRRRDRGSLREDDPG